MAKGGQDSEPRAAARSGASKPFISPLTRRILTVNLLAIGTLVAGLLLWPAYSRLAA